ncbi:MAG: hypothetical protein BRC40_13735 [Cyanobacteria bacterium QH_8_48_120]|jgi:uncharacterized protein (DUF169 family)|nr:MAG: hypothetical protein BRC34_13600 [Cyanobacteria bacterium QH_1_48_107]PSO56320.1 MAG: hypothetical protein BRC35_09420 [Cyanobacteria bacterium QH_10_48_56]PSO57466.1 MAG: hypothetical protein BRC39_14930 [Cyanobacteria bacterium QH_7_48_89]PSO64844.1 MAG: hypothetical protein BRC38_10680 [Cyanobacteria bacterium QH_6_48_35]PSO70178.1 MAG: hypothetical protein BRC40_13735 [Cyanobacteria bacterium QH_8_48_120]PSO74512.1 MAG: hypothetical protein BRC37_06955 [Cyanobacteria bacterium QH_3
MIMNPQSFADQLIESLELESSPVALQFVREPPKDIPQFEGKVHASCAFWRHAERGLFYTSASDHANCPIGVHTMGLPTSEETATELEETVQQMSKLGYIDPAEVAKIPTVSGEKSGIVYGPLAEMETPPDAILLWVTPYQAMLLNEAMGEVAWSQPSGTSLLGRPGCAAIPAALNQGKISFSLGCMGMRTFTEIAQDRMLVVLPCQALPTLMESLQRIIPANQKMKQFYQQKRVTNCP